MRAALPLMFCVIACGETSAGPPNDDGKATATSTAAATGGSGGTTTTAGGMGGSGGSGGAVTPQVLLPKTALDKSEIAVVVNDQDPQSVNVAAAYVAARGLDPSQVVTLSFPSPGHTMPVTDFTPLKDQLDAALSDDIQALAISWTTPWRVGCMSVTSAFSLGYVAPACNSGGGCVTGATQPYYASDSVAPFTDHGFRPAMMLAGETEADALALIDRGVTADDSFPTGDGYMIRTTDQARSVRWGTMSFTADLFASGSALDLTYIDNSDGSGSNVLSNAGDVLFYLTGLANVADIATNIYLPGAAADHLTSFGGQLTTSSQMSILRWLEAGATGSYGTVVEPCNFTAKFPTPPLLVGYYYRGATLIEAYWKSVYRPHEGIFVGDPLVRPWGDSIVDIQADKITITTTMLVPNYLYRIEAGPTTDGPWREVKTLTISEHARTTIEIDEATDAFYRVTL